MVYKIALFLHKKLSKIIILFIDKTDVSIFRNLIVTTLIIFIVTGILIDMGLEKIIETTEEKQKKEQEKEKNNPWWKLKKYGGWI